MKRKRPKGVKKAPIRRFSHRTHPAKLYLPPPGVCRWCASDILTVDNGLNRSQKFCGRLCENAFRLHTDPKVMRAYVWKRDMGICRECGKKHPLTGDWEADHIQPLFISCGDWNFWAPENVEVLCKSPCHEDKTLRDRIRYTVKKIERRRPRY